MTKLEISPLAVRPMHTGDSRSRCKFCSIEIRKDRLAKHLISCEITCFNFLHNIINQKIEQKPFSLPDNVILTNNIGQDTQWIPMEKINIYKTVKKFSDTLSIKPKDKNLLPNNIE